jgi:hypothetical protein
MEKISGLAALSTRMGHHLLSSGSFSAQETASDNIFLTWQALLLKHAGRGGPGTRISRCIKTNWLDADLIRSFTGCPIEQGRKEHVAIREKSACHSPINSTSMYNRFDEVESSRILGIMMLLADTA